MAVRKHKPHKALLKDVNTSANVVAENAAEGTLVGITMAAKFKHLKGPIKYTLLDDANGAFAINPRTGVVTVADGSLLDFEFARCETITVLARIGKSYAYKTFKIGIDDVNETELISVAVDGSAGGGGSRDPSISGDGRYVTYESSASNLVPEDTNGRVDIFVFDRQTGITERVSVASDGTQGNHDSAWSSISWDGRYVTFGSRASNLVPNDTNSDEDIFVFDRLTDTIERVSVASDGTQGNEYSDSPSISGDGRYVAYNSWASNLVPGDTGGRDIFVFDRDTDTTEKVSIAIDGTSPNRECTLPRISADGRYVAYQSQASNLVEGDTNGATDVFVFDRKTDTTERISVASDGSQGNGTSARAAISADGRYVAFSSYASNLVEGDTNGLLDVFVFDRLTHATERVSVASDGTQANAVDGWCAISADGRYVTYSSAASNLVPGDTNGFTDVFVFDRQTHTTTRVSMASDGTQPNDNSSRFMHPAVSADGSYVAYQSYASNLVPDDTSNTSDIFVTPTYEWLV